jgi:7-cyano-7-deazaguanine synthase in queuosine biosynthesis
MKIKKKNLTQLRRDFPVFNYASYKWKFKGKDLEIVFSFVAGKYSFSPEVKLKNIPASAKKIKKQSIDNFVFNLGLVELLSYWKAFCAPTILIKPNGLSASQIKWWQNLLFNGMGQFFYENKINFKAKNFVTIIADKKSDLKPYKFNLTEKNILVPIGGGKDSAVVLDLLKAKKKNVFCFLLNPTKASVAMTKASGCKQTIVCEREIDSQLLKLNREGYLNGHTPFLAYLSFGSVLVAALFNQKHIIIGNEKSSNEGNTFYLGEEINHQYSKTLDFENNFREYAKKYLSPSIDYFSILRPIYELQIAKLFASDPKYFQIFVSCNEAEKTYSGTKQKTGELCGECSKCLFVYMILYPFLKPTELKNIFKKDLYNDKNLISLMIELTSEKKVKPLECVGTKKESLIALYLGWKKNVIKGVEQPLLLKYFEKNLMPAEKDWEKEAKKILNNWDNKNNIPKKFDYKKYISQ